MECLFCVGAYYPDFTVAALKMTVPRLRGDNHSSNGTECKVVMDTEVAAIVHLRQAFDKLMHELQSVLDTCDNGCPDQHYTRVVTMAREVKHLRDALRIRSTQLAQIE